MKVFAFSSTKELSLNINFALNWKVLHSKVDAQEFLFHMNRKKLVLNTNFAEKTAGICIQKVDLQNSFTIFT